MESMECVKYLNSGMVYWSVKHFKVHFVENSYKFHKTQTIIFVLIVINNTGDPPMYT